MNRNFESKGGPFGPLPEMPRRRFLAGAAALAVASLAAGRQVSAQPARSVVVYSTTHPAIQALLTQAFTEKTGITVQSLRLNSSAMAQRFLAEQNAGQYICDVLTLGNDIFFRDVAQAGLLADISGRPGIASFEEFWRPDPHFVVATAAPASIGYNRKLVPAEAVPQGWQDILRPEFKGRIVLTDPRVNESLLPFPAMLQESYGDDFLRALAAQEPKLVPVTQQGVEQVAAGEAALVLPCNPGNLERYQGQDAPIALAPIPTPIFWTPFYTGIPVNAPNRAEAEAWFDFLMSRDGQAILCKNVSVSPLPDVPDALPRPPGKLENYDLEDAKRKASELFDLLGLPA